MGFAKKMRRLLRCQIFKLSPADFSQLQMEAFERYEFQTITVPRNFKELPAQNINQWHLVMYDLSEAPKYLQELQRDLRMRLYAEHILGHSSPSKEEGLYPSPYHTPEVLDTLSPDDVSHTSVEEDGSGHASTTDSGESFSYDTLDSGVLDFLLDLLSGEIIPTRIEYLAAIIITSVLFVALIFCLILCGFMFRRWSRKTQ